MLVSHWQNQIFQRVDQTKGIVVDTNAFEQLTHDQVIDHSIYEWIDCRVLDLMNGDCFRTFNWDTGRIEGTKSHIFYVYTEPEYSPYLGGYVIECDEALL